MSRYDFGWANWILEFGLAYVVIWDVGTYLSCTLLIRFFLKDKCSKTDNTWLFRLAIWTIALNYLNRSEKDHSIPWKVLNCRTATHEQTRALTAIGSTANHFPRPNFKRSRCTSNCLAAETITKTSYKLPMWSEETHTSNCNRLRQETTAQDDMSCKLTVRHKTRALLCKAGNCNAAKLLRNEAAILRDHLGPSTKHAKLYIFLIWAHTSGVFIGNSN